MKKIILILATMMFCLTLGGCNISESPLTEEELDAVAEYAADLLLKYDKNYRAGLLTQEELDAILQLSATPTPTPTPEHEQNTVPPGETAELTGTPMATPTLTPTPTVTPVPDNSEATDMQLMDVLDVPAESTLSVSYLGYEVTKSVMRGDYFLMEAPEGKQYLVTHFLVINDAAEPAVLDASDLKLECMLDINTGTKYQGSLSMLENDLFYSPVLVEANGMTSSIMVFEISDREEIRTAHLIVSNKNRETVFIKLK